MNVENLDALDPQDKFDELASIVVDNLRSPDILAVEEIQDNDGAASPAPTERRRDLRALHRRDRRRGGPPYEFRQIDPDVGTRRRRAERQHPRRLPVPARTAA